MAVVPLVINNVAFFTRDNARDNRLNILGNSLHTSTLLLCLQNEVNHSRATVCVHRDVQSLRI